MWVVVLYYQTRRVLHYLYFPLFDKIQSPKFWVVILFLAFACLSSVSIHKTEWESSICLRLQRSESTCIVFNICAPVVLPNQPWSIGAWSWDLRGSPVVSGTRMLSGLFKSGLRSLSGLGLFLDISKMQDLVDICKCLILNEHVFVFNHLWLVFDVFRYCNLKLWGHIQQFNPLETVLLQAKWTWIVYMSQ